MSFFKTALLVSLFVLTLTASPIHSITELDFVPTDISQPLIGSNSQLATSDAYRKLYDSSEITSKLHRRTQDFYIWRARPLEPIIPTHLAASVLQEFCSAILAQINEQWSLQAQLSSFWIRHGNLELFVDSVDGPIPWSVVMSFAHKMLCAIHLGWVGTYDLIYQNDAANPAVRVILRFANNQLSLPQQQLTKSSTVKTAKRTDTKKPGEVQLTAFKVHGAIVPLSVAAPYVKAFFGAIAAEASSAWASRPESALFTVTQGRFQLTVSCLGARIPWPMLVSAAQKFSALADHSWVNTFDAFYEEQEFSITIAISLRLLQEATGPGLMTIPPPTRRNLQTRSLPAKSTAPLRPRSPFPPMSPGMRVTSFIQTAALVPSALAAAKLEDFYTIVALKIETGQLANLPPSKNVVCSLWDFELFFSCDKINIPLSFVQAFAIDMAEWSSRQFTGFYEATVRGEGPLSGLVFYVQMRLKGKGQQSTYFK